jgi:4-amino-4-deoxy-L-arabinose transferase-like glycosyltransferase
VQRALSATEPATAVAPTSAGEANRATGARAAPVAFVPLVLVALVKLLPPLLVDPAYGFHRDELAVLDDARHLAWGYVAYPPLTPALARVALDLFGPTTVGLRLVGALSQALAAVLAGLIARELGGGRTAQLTAAAAVAVAPVSVVVSVLYSYVALDYLWWVLVVYLLLRLLNGGTPRWWLAIGVAAGLGLETKWTVLAWLAALAAGLLLTPARRQLATAWPWAGAALALAAFLPNLLWQTEHGVVSLAFLGAIHDRDVALGRTDGFPVDQLWLGANPLTVPLWVAGLWALLRAGWARPYRALGWAWLIALALLLVARGRGYYAAAAYPALLAAGAV